MPQPTDETTSVAQLRQLVAEFVDERDWQQFHTPKNLTMALSIEVAELMEHFQWLTPQQSRDLANDADKTVAAGEELADVLCYALAIANELNIDVAQAMHDKMIKNRQKYPAEQFRGRYGPEDAGDQ